MTTALVVTGVAHVVTAWALVPARVTGRAVLAAGGVATLAVAAVPLPSRTSSSVAHTVVATLSFVLLAVWPWFARTPRRPAGPRAPGRTARGRRADRGGGVTRVRPSAQRRSVSTSGWSPSSRWRGPSSRRSARGGGPGTGSGHGGCGTSWPSSGSPSPAASWASAPRPSPPSPPRPGTTRRASPSTRTPCAPASSWRRRPSGTSRWASRASHPASTPSPRSRPASPTCCRAPASASRRCVPGPEELSAAIRDVAVAVMVRFTARRTARRARRARPGMPCSVRRRPPARARRGRGRRLGRVDRRHRRLAVRDLPARPAGDVHARPVCSAPSSATRASSPTSRPGPRRWRPTCATSSPCRPRCSRSTHAAPLRGGHLAAGAAGQRHPRRQPVRPDAHDRARRSRSTSSSTRATSSTSAPSRRGRRPASSTGIESVGVPYLFVRGNHDATSATDTALLDRLAERAQRHPARGRRRRLHRGDRGRRAHRRASTTHAGSATRAPARPRSRCRRARRSPPRMPVGRPPTSSSGTSRGPSRACDGGVLANGHMHSVDLEGNRVQAGTFTGGGPFTALPRRRAAGRSSSASRRRSTC